MTGFNTVDDVPEMERNTYTAIIEQVVEEGPVEDYEGVSRGRYDFMEGLIEGFDGIYIDDDVTGTNMTHDDPLEYFQWKEHGDRILGEVVHTEEDGKHPVFEFDDVENDFDEHVFYLSVHPEKKVAGKNRAVPEINMNGFSIDYDDDMVYFGSMQIVEDSSF